MIDYPSKHIKRFNPSTDERVSDAKQKIYHYTSTHGIYELLRKATIRFTDCQYLNDKSEYTHVKEPLEVALNEIEKEGNLQSDFKSILLDMLSDSFESDEVESIGTDSNLIFNFTKKRYYVFCASTSKDSLGMWNYYVKNNNYQGYNLEFIVNRLLNCFLLIENRKVDVFYGNVIYNQTQKVSILKQLLVNADKDIKKTQNEIRNFDEIDIAEQEIVGEVLSFIENYRLFFKSEAFKDEKEYRFVLKLPLGYTPKENDRISIGFDIKGGVFIPYCELTINRSDTISSINISPMIESDLASRGLKRYLLHNGYSDNIIIEQSKIPIRY